MDTVVQSPATEQDLVEPNSGQVFVDSSGRRARRVRRGGYLIGVSCVGYIGAVAMGLSGTRVASLPEFPAATSHEIVAGLSGSGTPVGLKLTPRPVIVAPPAPLRPAAVTPVRPLPVPARRPPVAVVNTSGSTQTKPATPSPNKSDSKSNKSDSSKSDSKKSDSKKSEKSDSKKSEKSDSKKSDSKSKSDDPADKA